MSLTPTSARMLTGGVILILLCMATLPMRAFAAEPLDLSLVYSIYINPVTDTQNRQWTTNSPSFPPKSDSNINPGGASLIGVYDGGKQMAWSIWPGGVACSIDGAPVDVAIVYEVGGSKSGTVACPPEIRDDSMTRSEDRYDISYTSQAEFMGQKLVLTGSMTIKIDGTYKSAQTAMRIDSKKVITQTAILLLSGNTCKIEALQVQVQEVGVTTTTSGFVENSVIVDHLSPTGDTACTVNMRE